MAKILKIVVLIFGGGMLLVALTVVVLTVRFNWNDNRSKQLLAKEVTALTVADGCTEKYRTYIPGGVDTNSSWHVYYICNTTGGAAYGTIHGALVARGYTAKEDRTIPDPTDPKSLRYDFTYQNAGFQVSYRFFSQNKNVTADQANAMQTLHVDEIDLWIYRAGRTY